MKKNIVIVTLVLIVLIMGGALYYLNNNKDKLLSNCEKQKTETTTEEAATEETKKTFEYGKYEYIGETASGKDIDIIEFLEDGTYFEYEANTMGTTFYGTYTIDGNNITLNQTFRMDNESTGGSKEAKTYTVKLEENKIVKDNKTLAKNDNAESAKNKFIEWTTISVAEYSSSVSNN